MYCFLKNCHSSDLYFLLAFLFRSQDRDQRLGHSTSMALQLLNSNFTILSFLHFQMALTLAKGAFECVRDVTESLEDPYSKAEKYFQGHSLLALGTNESSQIQFQCRSLLG